MKKPTPRRRVTRDKELKQKIETRQAFNEAFAAAVNNLYEASLRLNVISKPPKTRKLRHKSP